MIVSVSKWASLQDQGDPAVYLESRRDFWQTWTCFLYLKYVPMYLLRHSEGVFTYSPVGDPH